MTFRRAPEAIVSALQMDRTLRNLFVEGRKDRLFVEWLSGDQLTCELTEIGDIEIYVEAGGNRARAVTLSDYLRSVLSSDEEVLDRVRVLVDADFDHLDGKAATLPLMLTDGRCLESYLLRRCYFRKIFLFALQKQDIDPDAIFNSTVKIGTTLAALREVDRQESLHLPFQSQNFKAHIVVNSVGVPSLRLAKLIAELLQKAGLPVAEVASVRSRIEQASEEFRTRDPIVVVHGHDLEAVLGEVVQKLQYPRLKIGALMRSAFERQHVADYPMLSSIVAFAVAS